MNAAIAVVAMIVEYLVGYPRFLNTTIRHPVEWMGGLLTMMEKAFNRPDRPGSERRMGGMTALVVLLAATYLVSITLVSLLNRVPSGWAIEGLLASTMISQKQLGDMVKAVANAFGDSLQRAREAVGHLVGRDVRKADEAAVSRAAIESLAENASDGVIAPLFWMLLFGLPGAALYKAINTADSMVGHQNERYADFGWAAAKLDDLVNWIPARLTAVLFILAASIMPGASGAAAWSAARNDGPRHRSPNAGWPEAAMAGALSIGLGGPREYDGDVVDLPAMGIGERNIGPSDIKKALALYAAATGIAFVVVTIFALATFRGA